MCIAWPDLPLFTPLIKSAMSMFSGVTLTESERHWLTHNETYFESVVRKMRTAEPTLELGLACLFAIFVS